MKKTATVIGATGLIGRQLVRLLLEDEHYGQLRILVRRPYGLTHPKLQEVIVNFDDSDDFKSAVSGSDAIFCSVGTTQKKTKGNKTAYRKVDYEIPLNAAIYGASSGCSHFLLVSSVGADRESGNFYLRLKGEVEEKLKKINVATVSVFRPSFLLGKRDEFRLGEILAKPLSVAFSFLFPSRFKPIRASEVARSMIAVSKRDRPGYQIYHFREMKEFIRQQGENGDII